MKHHASLTIDGEPVHVECDRLTVAQLNALLALCGERGAEPRPVSRRVALERIDTIDRHVRMVEGSCFMLDEAPAREGLARVYASRDDVIVDLYDALLAAQHLTEKEQFDLMVAARFRDWLSSPKRISAQWKETGASCRRCHELNYCKMRGCDGEEKKRVVWHDKRLVLKTCPVLSLTIEVEAVLRLFFWSHAPVVDGTSVRWQQIHFLEPGGLNEQDAWLTGAFAYLRNVNAEIVRDALEKSRG